MPHDSEKREARRDPRTCLGTWKGQSSHPLPARLLRGLKSEPHDSRVALWPVPWHRVWESIHSHCQSHNGGSVLQEPWGEEALFQPGR